MREGGTALRPVGPPPIAPGLTVARPGPWAWALAASEINDSMATSAAALTTERFILKSPREETGRIPWRSVAGAGLL